MTVPILLLWLATVSMAHDGSRVKDITSGVSRHIRSIGFPEGSGAGIFFAIGIPVDIPDKSVLFSFYFEANYGLPSFLNSSYFVDDFFFQRSLTRQLTYKILESKLKSVGYDGKECLLKTICESFKCPLSQNGLIGDILRIVFSPSTSIDENLSPEFTEAENVVNCEERYKNCSISIFERVC